MERHEDKTELAVLDEPGTQVGLGAPKTHTEITPSSAMEVTLYPLEITYMKQGIKHLNFKQKE